MSLFLADFEISDRKELQLPEQIFPVVVTWILKLGIACKKDFGYTVQL